MSRYQSVLGIHRTGPGEKRVSDLEGDSSLVLVEGIVLEKIVLENVLEEVLEGIPSCHPVQVEHWEDSVCHLCVDPSQPLDER